MSTDRFALQIFADHCAAAAESMGHTLMRTAHSTFVKETEDFSCQILTREGLTVASPKSFGATWFTGLDYGPVIRYFDTYQPGDICLTNDPYSGFVATHPPDMHLWKPVFWQGQLGCFVGCHIHNTDVGGAVPASLSRTLSEVQQEGIRIPPTRLCRDGVFNAELLRVLETNVRAPEQNRGDLNAQIAAVNIGERKVGELIERFGFGFFEQGMHDLMDYADQQARRIVRDIPDGCYPFADLADEDLVDGFPCRIMLTVRVEGDTLVLDYTGSDPQLASSLNMPTGGNERHALATVGLIYVLYTLDPTITLNAGTVRCARAILPEGTVMNAQKPAAVGMRSLLSNLAQTVTFGAFARALPERLPAGPASAVSLVNVKTTDRFGRMVMASIGPIGGGAGGGPAADGIDGSGANNSFLKNTPVEITESEIPINIHQYGLVRDLGGAGLFRGGLGAVFEFQVTGPQSVVTARNRDRTRFAAWGLCGGRAGRSSSFTRNPGTPGVVELGNTDVVHCEPGDVIRLVGPGAGGYGDPFTRPVEQVVADVRRGFVSLESARRDYGVAIGPDISPNADLTRRLREDRPETQTNNLFDWGENRREFDRVWTEERYAALTRILMHVVTPWRFYVKHQIFRAIADNVAPEGGGTEAVYAAYRALAERFADLPPLEQIGGAGDGRPLAS